MLREFLEQYRRYGTPVLFADGGSSSDGDSASDGSTDDHDQQDKVDASNSGDGKQAGKFFTQEDLDRLIARERRKEREKLLREQEEERKRAQMTAEEKARAEKEEAERKAQEAIDRANRRIIAAEAKVIASDLGVKPERISYLLKLADLSSIDVDDNGEPDSKAIREAIEAVLKDLPELKGATSTPAAGTDFSGQAGQSKSLDTQLREALEKGDIRTSIALKRQQLFKR